MGFPNPDLERRPFAALRPLPEVFGGTHERHRYNRHACLFNEIGHTLPGRFQTGDMGSGTFRRDQDGIARFEDPDQLGQQRTIIVTAMDGDDAVGPQELSLKGLVEYIDRPDDLQRSRPEGAGQRRSKIDTWFMAITPACHAEYSPCR